MAELNEIVTKAKERYGKVFKVSFNGIDDYFVRSIPRLEYRGITDALEAVAADPKKYQELHDEKVVQVGLVFPVATPDFFSNSGAGVVPLLADRILKVSGWTPNIEVTEV